MNSVCPKCGGLGAQIISLPNGATKIRTCECRARLHVSHGLKVAAIPKRYAHCGFENFETAFPGAHPSLQTARLVARRFVDGYPVTTEGRGLLFVGSAGVGKTHLAVAILNALVAEKGVHGFFCGYRELLKQISHSYNPQVATTEMDVLRPVFDAEVLVLDELGATRANDWIWNTVALILNSRYNNKLSTIITTHLEDLPGADPEPEGFTDADWAKRSKMAARQQTLGDRIGETMRSRVAEMCVSIKMEGKDFRQTVGRARFG